MWEPVALCCFSRRTGCLVLGALELVGAILGLLVGAFVITVGEVGYFTAICRREQQVDENCLAIVRTSVETTSVIGMICAVVQLVCASMMIHGVRKDDHCLMCPFLIKNVIVVVVHIILASVAVILLLIMAFPAGILAAYCYGALIFMWTYFLLTVRAYYYELKRGKHVDHHRLIEQSDMDIGLRRE